MGKYYQLLLFVCAYMAPTRACSSRGSNSAEPSPDYYDYEKQKDKVGRSGNITVGGKVLNGNEATHGDFPHLVSLQATKKGNKHFCGASIIHPKYLLSAAHCFGQHKIPHIRAVAGEHDLRVSDGNREQIRNVTRGTIHENYDATTKENDIALLELNQRLQFDNRYVSPITLRHWKWDLPEQATVSGWGLTDAAGSRPDRLMAADIKIRKHENCTERFVQKNYVVTDYTICAGGSRDACSGDSGGPLTCSRDSMSVKKQYYLCGIVSWGVDCDDPLNSDYPGVYTDVAQFEDWIEREIPAIVYFGAEGGQGISAVLESQRNSRTLVRNANDPEGLTFNWLNNKFYYAEDNRIRSADEDGANVQTVFECKRFGPIKGLAVDWITGNLYGVNRYGFVFVCKVQRNEQLSCTHPLREQGNLLGIALDPNNG